MTKKILSVLTSVAVLGSIACASAVNTSAFSGQITFEINEGWKNANRTFYAHIWDGREGGAGLYEWQTKDEKMTISEDGNTATYEVPEGEWNLIIISGDSGMQTYDSVFNSSCIGDSCYVMDKQFENPVDSKKKAWGLGWRNNADCGPHKVVTSIGNVSGTAFLPGENDQNLYDNFVAKYNTDNVADGKTKFNWNDDGKVETGMTWDEAKKFVADQLGITVESSETPTDATSSDNTSNNNASSNTSSTTSTTSSNTSSSSSSQSTGTTTTGDNTPIVALVATLTAALGVAFATRKKAVK